MKFDAENKDSKAVKSESSTKHVWTRAGSIDSFVCGFRKKKYASKNLPARSETVTIELGKTACLEIYANLQ